MPFFLYYRQKGNVRIEKMDLQVDVYDALLASIEANFSLRQIFLPPFWYLNLSFDDLVSTAIALPRVDSHQQIVAVHDTWNEKIHVVGRVHDRLVKITTKAAAGREKETSIISLFCLPRRS